MPQPVGQLLTDLAAAEPGRALLTCGTEVATRSELERRANRLARAYDGFGVRQGDFVTIALPNGIEFFAAAFAVWKLGAIPQPVSPKLPPRELAAIVELADPPLVVGPPDVCPGRASVPGGYEPGDEVDDGPIVPPRVPPAWKAPTSGGSTGRPKLIVSGTPGQFDFEAAGRAFGVDSDGVQLVPGPLYHNAPLTFAMMGVYVGQHVVVMPRFDAVAALDAIAQFKVDFVNLVPTMMHRMLREIEADPERYDLSSLRTVWHMAAPCPAWLKEAWIGLVGPDHLFELYGGTEAQVMTRITGREWLEHRGSVGRPTRGEIAILDPGGQPLPAGEVGEIFLRPPADASPSYRYIGAEARVRDGWESLGDMGWLDEDGYLYISDRRTDMIVSGGANIYPAEVEAALSEHPQIRSCVVVGLPDHDLGQAVHAVVDAQRIDEEELRTFLAHRLVRYKIPRSFRFVDVVLRDDAGKVRRSAIKEAEIAARAAADLASDPASAT